MFELLDARTLFFAGALVAGTFTPVMFGFLLTHETYPGYRYWACSELAFSILFFLQAIRGLIGEFIPVVVGNTIACFAMVLLAEGMRKFCGQGAHNRWVYAGSTVFLCGIQYFFFIKQDFRIRTLLSGSYLAVMSAYAALPLLRRAPKGRRFGFAFASTILLFASLMGVIRVVGVARMEKFTTMFSHDPINIAFYLTDLMFIIGITFSFFLLTNERVRADLRDSNQGLAQEVETRLKAESALQSEMAERRRIEDRLKELVREGAQKNRELKNANETIEMLARTDRLTGLANRRMLEEVLPREVARANRLKESLSIIFVDVDLLKPINDQFGHKAGDQVLTQLGTVFKDNLRSYALATRFGGDEFVLLLPGTDIDGAVVVAERIREKVGIVAIPECPRQIAVSMGIATLATGETGEELVARADEALYRAKGKGGNRVEIA